MARKSLTMMLAVAGAALILAVVRVASQLRALTAESVGLISERAASPAAATTPVTAAVGVPPALERVHTLPPAAASKPDRSDRCEQDLRLLASVVNDAHPERSLAAVNVWGGTRVLRVGERVGEHTFVGLRPRQALFREADGALCTLRVSPTTKPEPRAPAAVVARRGKAPLFTAAELSRSIRQLGPDSFAVSRELLEKALGSPAQLRRFARYRIASKDGRVQGVQLSGLPAQSPLARLGLQKGDVIRSMNGLDFSDPRGALEALTKLRDQQQFSLAVLRDGAPRTLSYRVE